MKPNFALDLSHDGINLLHRGKNGWSLVGSVGLDDPEFMARLSDLHMTAAQLANGHFTCKLIIPNSQVLYTVVDASGPDDIAREVQIRAALDGLTPYPVGELVFDWRAEGDKARVAVVARDTLDEAEAFAAENKFNPVSFVARPGRGDMSGEPFFGKTKAATRLLEPGERVEPDAAAVPRASKSKSAEDKTETEQAQVTETPVDPPQPDPAPQAEAAPEPVAPPAPKPAPKADRAPIPELGDPFAELDALAEELSGAFDPKPEPAPEAAAPEAPATKRSGRKEPGEPKKPALAPFPAFPGEDDDEAKARPFLPGKPTKAPARDTAKREPTLPRPAPKAPLPVIDDEEPAQTYRAEPSEPSAQATGFAEKTSLPPFVEPAEPKPAEAEAPKPQAPASTPAPAPASDESDTPAPSFAFSSRRAPSEAEAGKPPALASASRGSSAPTPPKSALSASAAVPQTKDTMEGGSPFARLRTEMADALAKPLPTPDRPFQPEPKGPGLMARVRDTATGLIPARKPADATTDASATPETSEKPQTTETPDKPSARALPLPKRNRNPKRAEEEARRAREAEALTVFGARKTQEIGGKPRYLGLILTLLLLLIMAVIVVWSSFFVQDGQVSLFNPSPDVAALSTPDDQTTADLGGTPDVTPLDTPVPDDTTLALVAPDTTPAVAEPDPTSTTDGLTTAQVLSAEEAAAYYADTGIWQHAPEALAGPDLSTVSTQTLAGLVGGPARHELSPLPGITPEASFDIARADPMPPPAPNTSFALDENGLIEPKPDGAISPAGILVFAGKPALVPPPRPGDTTTAETVAADSASPDTTDTTDTPATEALVDTANLLRPPPRPTDLAAADSTDDSADASTPEETDAMAADIAGGAIDAAIADAVENPFVGSTELAVASSRQPSPRPANFSTIVASAQIGASDGSAVSVPAPAAAAPAIPTSASVAAQATTENAINLREINVIGIYGTSNTRRALVRLANGRYVRVKVGDRLDGGKVTSISANQLTYQKGNRVFKLDVLPLG